MAKVGDFFPMAADGTLPSTLDDGRLSISMASNGYGSQKSQKSRQSIGVISIFADQTRAGELAHGAEVTYDIYDISDDGRNGTNASAASAAVAPAPTLRTPGAQRVRSVSQYETDESGLSLPTDGMQPLEIATLPNESISMTQPSVEKTPSTCSDIKRPSTDAKVKKAGSFQMKSAYSGSANTTPDASLKKSSSNASGEKSRQIYSSLSHTSQKTAPKNAQQSAQKSAQKRAQNPAQKVTQKSAQKPTQNTAQNSAYNTAQKTVQKTAQKTDVKNAAVTTSIATTDAHKSTSNATINNRDNKTASVNEIKTPDLLRSTTLDRADSNASVSTLEAPTCTSQSSLSSVYRSNLSVAKEPGTFKMNTDIARNGSASGSRKVKRPAPVPPAADNDSLSRSAATALTREQHSSDAIEIKFEESKFDSSSIQKNVKNDDNDALKNDVDFPATERIVQSTEETIVKSGDVNEQFSASKSGDSTEKSSKSANRPGTFVMSNSHVQSEKTISTKHTSPPKSADIQIDGNDVDLKRNYSSATELSQLSADGTTTLSISSLSSSVSANADKPNTNNVQSATKLVKAEESVAATSETSAIRNREFKSQLSSLISPKYGPVHVASSAPTSLARDKATRTSRQQSSPGDGEEGQAFEIHTFPRDTKQADENVVVSSFPTSPLQEINDTVKEGTVGKLVKDIFWNMPLTGGCMDGSTLQKRENKASTATLSDGSVTATSSSTDNKQFRFPIEGIDTADVTSDEVTSQSITKTGETSVIEVKNETGIPQDESPPDFDSIKRGMEKRGFRAMIDIKLANEIKQKAKDVTSRRPHESVEEKSVKERHVNANRESLVLKEIRDNLNKQILEREQSKQAMEGGNAEVAVSSKDADMLKEAREKLNRQESDKRTASTYSSEKTVMVTKEPTFSTSSSTGEEQAMTLNQVRERLNKHILERTRKRELKSDAAEGDEQSQDIAISDAISNDTKNVDATAQTSTEISTVSMTTDKPIPVENSISTDEDVFDSMLTRTSALPHVTVLQEKDKPPSKDVVNSEINISRAEQENSERDVQQEYHITETKVTEHKQYAPDGATGIASQSKLIDGEEISDRDEEYTDCHITTTDILKSNKYTLGGDTGASPEQPASPAISERDTEYRVTTISVTDIRNKQADDTAAADERKKTSSDAPDSAYQSDVTFSPQFETKTTVSSSLPVIEQEDVHVHIAVKDNAVTATDDLLQPTSDSANNDGDIIYSADATRSAADLTTRNDEAVERSESERSSTDEPEALVYRYNGNAGAPAVDNRPPNAQPDEAAAATLIEAALTSNWLQGSAIRQTLRDYGRRDPNKHVGRAFVREIRAADSGRVGDITREEDRRGDIFTFSDSSDNDGDSDRLKPAKNNRRSPTVSLSPTLSVISELERVYYRPRADQPAGSLAVSISDDSLYDGREPPSYERVRRTYPRQHREWIRDAPLKPLTIAVNTTDQRDIVSSEHHTPTTYHYNMATPPYRVTGVVNGHGMTAFDTHRQPRQVRGSSATDYQPQHSTTTTQRVTRNVRYANPPYQSPAPLLYLAGDSMRNVSPRHLGTAEHRSARVPVSRRSSRGHHVARVQLDGAHPAELEAMSTYSEPGGYNSGKYSVQQRAMRDRIISSPTSEWPPPHPDMQYERRTMYQVSRDASSSARDLTSIDPELRDASKEGRNYHITLNLKGQHNGVRNGSNSQYETVSSYDYINQHSPLQLQQQRQNILHQQQQQQYLVQQQQLLLQPSPGYVLSPNSTTIEDHVDRLYAVQSHYNNNNDVHYDHNVNQTNGYTVANVTETTHQPVNQRAKPRQNGTEPSFSMQVNQTMTMGYTPEEQEAALHHQQSAHEQVNDGYYVKRVTETQRQAPVTHQQTTSTSRRIIETTDVRDGQERRVQQKTKRKKKAKEEDDMPQVIRGDILIKNSIDTCSAPKVIDIVEGEDSEDEAVVAENVNPFHGHYMQRRENPMYSSDQDLTQIDERVVNERVEVTHQKASPPRRFASRTEERVRRNNNRAIRVSTDADDFDTEIKVTKGYISPDRVKNSRTEKWLETDMTDGPASASKRRSKTTRSEFDVTTLLKNAPPNSIRQTIKVEREEEEIIGPLPSNTVDGPDGLLNYDTVSENVDLGMCDGKAQLAIKVRCERIVPIKGVEDMFKKSSVIVTRLIEIDLQATDDRRQLYDYVMRRSAERDVSGGSHVGSRNKLSTKDTFKLYKAFMNLAESEEGAGLGLQQETLHIDRNIEDQRRPDLTRLRDADMVAGGGGVRVTEDEEESDFFDVADLERRLDQNLPAEAFGLHRQDSDNISYASVMSGPSDILY